jgi:dTDP-4-amino-4,6-dideoxygalactose transaminase
LQSIDERRWYSNYGPLANHLEERIGSYLGMAESGVVTTANATIGLTATLLARKVAAGSLCIMPSWTFAATPHAARAAGMIPWFHDVDRCTWALNPEEVLETLKDISGTVGAVMVVSPFGAPVDLLAWEVFEDRTGIAVVLDAAAGFDTILASRIPVVVSLHATKILGAGEGGFVATTDVDLLDRIRTCCNFGLRDTRSALLPSLNGKMSEYHAAVALASLARWPETRKQHVTITEWYCRGVADLEEVALRPGYGKGWVSGTTTVMLSAGLVAQAAEQLLERGIDTRAWWGDGCHVQPAFADCPRGPLPVTESLGPRVLGLPHFPDMRQHDVDRVVSTLSEVLSAGRRVCGMTGA